MNERIVIIDGLRSPFCKAGGSLKDTEPDDLGGFVLSELLARHPEIVSAIDEVIIGNVLQPPVLANIARLVAVKGGVPIAVPSFTVNRNCASGLESIVSAYNRLRLGDAQVIIAGGTESMSNYPVTVKKKYREFLQKLGKAKTFGERAKILMSFRLGYLVPETPEIGDPLCSLSMGQTAEILAREFKVTREDQDLFALRSQQRTAQAIKSGFISEEIVPVPATSKFNKMQVADEGPRDNQTLEALQKLKPAFDRFTGTVTAGNSSQVTDGAGAIILMTESKAKELELKPLAYILGYAAAGLQPSRMGLGPVFSTAKLLQKMGKELSEFDLIEINEAFAAQVLACQRAFESDLFAQKELGRSKAVGKLDIDKLNVNGGAIALGHPLGASGTRLVITLVHELRRRGLQKGIATLCIGGGQGEALALEVAP